MPIRSHQTQEGCQVWRRPEPLHIGLAKANVAARGHYGQHRPVVEVQLRVMRLVRMRLCGVPNKTLGAAIGQGDVQRAHLQALKSAHHHAGTQPRAGQAPCVLIVKSC